MSVSPTASPAGAADAGDHCAGSAGSHHCHGRQLAPTRHTRRSGRGEDQRRVRLVDRRTGIMAANPSGGPASNLRREPVTTDPGTPLPLPGSGRRPPAPGGGEDLSGADSHRTATGLVTTVPASTASDRPLVPGTSTLTLADGDPPRTRHPGVPPPLAGRRSAFTRSSPSATIPCGGVGSVSNAPRPPAGGRQRSRRRGAAPPGHVGSQTSTTRSAVIERSPGHPGQPRRPRTRPYACFATEPPPDSSDGIGTIHQPGPRPAPTGTHQAGMWVALARRG